MNYTELIGALSLEMRLDLTGTARPEHDDDRDRTYTIRFDAAVDVMVQFASDAPEAREPAPRGGTEAAARDVVHLHAVLAPAVGGAAARARVFAALMQIHLFGVATDGAYFGFDAERDRVTLSKAQPLCGIDTEQALRSVASFVDQCFRWNAALPLLAASE
ncbi:type III secretion system chaperone [Robbsia sp. Bb-Pol-6]|uniref:Type III secretion system chaperone n=1 Tax=Robbsia betulipollinis TaxID=2981849 RepID=A0ABT3ZL52_9BURK|nr:type III secretion system chaperone [Robbsia betulipollinis]MCY0387259.1 type III secretion system chaperone [Robbsia betulipollinis]